MKYGKITFQSRSSSSSSSGTTSPTSSRQKSTTSLKPIRASVEGDSADENGQEDPSANRTKNPEPIRNGSREITEGLVFFRNTRMAARIHRGVSEHRDSHASSSHETSWGPKRRSFWAIMVSLLSERAKLISARGLKLKGPHAQNVLVKLYLVQKILVNW